MSNTFTRLDTQAMPHEEAYKFLSSCVVPRPIAWVTTRNEDGSINAAPFSSFNYVCTSPPMLAINIELRGEGMKDTERNIRRTGEYVVNIASEACLEDLHHSAIECPTEISEVERLNLELLDSTHIPVPRLACTPVQMECKLEQILPLGRGRNTLFIGEVLAFHLSEQVYNGRHIDIQAMRPIARLGGPFYAGLGEITKRARLPWPPEDEGA